MLRLNVRVKRRRDNGCSERWSQAEKTTAWVSGVVNALGHARRGASRTDGTSRGKHDWVRALWQPCSFLTISCLQIPEYFTIFWKKKNVWFAILF